MYGILASAFNVALGWLVRTAVIKFVVFSALFLIVTEFIQLIVPMLPGVSGLTSAFAAQAPGIWFFLDLFKVGFGVSACLSALVTRFMIRRLPVVG